MGTLNEMRSGSASLLFLDSIALLAGLWTVENYDSDFSLGESVALVFQARALVFGAIGGSLGRLFYLMYFCV